MKRVLMFILCFLLLAGNVNISFAEAMGKLNVFTDLKGTEIYVDAKLAGEESVVGYVLPVGEHYVQVKYQGKTSYAKMVTIIEERTTTITSDNFVDIRTSTPSRGALDIEAERLREYRGNGAFGYFGTSPSSGLSIKWWFSKNFGLQAVGFTQTYTDYNEESWSGRFLVGFPQKIFAEEVLDAYLALGYGKGLHTDRLDYSRNIRSETSSISFGLEAKLGTLANALFLNQRGYFIQGTEDLIILVGEFMTLGILNLCYTSIELGLEQKTLYRGTTTDTVSNMMVNYGFHYYF